MSHTSPASYLVWAILSSFFCLFLVYHLWSFDRFKCLKWNNGLHTGAFKRIMTYSYILSVPAIMVYSISFAVIKYSEGFFVVPILGVVPKPYMLWTEFHRSFIFPLYLLFSVAWSLELVTHLEELCFWLFLVNAGSVQQDWFKSLYFRTWLVGAVIAIVYMPLVTILTHNDPLTCEAYTFLAGSLGSFSLTIWFIPILWTFPAFLQNLKNEGVDKVTVVRLTKFHELNTVRVILRLFMTVPLIILGIDGTRPHDHTINESTFWTDLLSMLAGFGCILSSAITLVIFFPRNIEGEILARETRQEARMWRSGQQTRDRLVSQNTTPKFNHSFRASVASQDDMEAGPSAGGKYGASPMSDLPPGLSYHTNADRVLRGSSSMVDVEAGRNLKPTSAEQTPYALTEVNLSTHNIQSSKVHPFVHNYTSPLDIMNR